MKKNTNKKGFTIVELVIVVAVIAILAAVLIPTFSSIVRKANVSSDKVLVRNLNTALAADTDGQETMQDALDAAAEYGYIVEKIDAKASGSQILWDQTKGEFVYSDNGAYPGGANVWQIASTAKVGDKYSTYLYGATETSFEIDMGIDAGKVPGIQSIKYATDKPQAVIIRTNSAATKLEIDAENSEVKHYGEVGNVTITAVKGNSYHENGEISGVVELKKGRLVVEEEAFVPEVKITGDAVKVETSKNIAVTVAENVSVENVVIKATKPSVQVSVQNNDLAAKVQGTTAVTMKNVATFEELKTAVNTGEKYILMTEDMESTEVLYVNHSCVIDGNGYALTGVGGARSSNKTNIAIGENASAKVDVEIRNLKITNTSTEASGRPIETRGNLNSLTLVNTVLESKTCSGYRQALTIGKNQADKAKVVIKNSTLDTGDGKGYPFIAFNPVDLTMNGSTVNGWCALYFKGEHDSAGSDGSIVNISYSQLISTNICKSGDTNNFGCLVFEDNNILVNIDSTTIKAEQTSEVSQVLFEYAKENVTGENTVSNITINVTGETTITYGRLQGNFEVSANSKINLMGGTYTELSKADISAFVPAGYTINETNAGCVVKKA